MKRLLFILGFALFVFKSSAQDFRVQIAAYADSMPAAYFKARGVVHYITTSDQMGLYRYFAGTYATRDEAEKVKNDMVARGFPYAYVIDLEEQRVLCGAGCPYFRNGVIFVKDTAHRKTVRNIYFDSGRFSLNKEAKGILDEMAVVLKENPKLNLTIKGYTDAVGSPKANIQLASSRSRSARNYLIMKGIRADRMFIKVYGEAEPLAPNKDDDGRDSPENMKINRRVMLAATDEKGEVGK